MPPRKSKEPPESIEEAAECASPDIQVAVLALLKTSIEGAAKALGMSKSQVEKTYGKTLEEGDKAIIAMVMERGLRIAMGEPWRDSKGRERQYPPDPKLLERFLTGIAQLKDKPAAPAPTVNIHIAHGAASVREKLLGDFDVGSREIGGRQRLLIEGGSVQEIAPEGAPEEVVTSH